MSDRRNITYSNSDLDALNGALANLFHVEPASVTFGAQTALADQLVLCGLLGGKDVGKSTLINALAGTNVSGHIEEVGEGTSRPMAYVHERMTSAVTTRLREIQRLCPVDVFSHTADELINVVLVDLPDFDSEFPAHLSVVRAVAPLLDRVLWVLTPRKIGDRAWVEMFHGVIKDTGNVYCVLNKVDELLTDAEPFGKQNGRTANDAAQRATRFWESQHEWVAQAIDASGCVDSGDRRYLIAAAFNEPGRFVSRIAHLWDDANWSKYATDREAVTQVARLAAGEFGRLRECVLSPLSAEDADRIKQANRNREREVAADRIMRHYDLERTIELLESACSLEHLQPLMGESFGPEYCTTVAESLRAGMRPESELADELLERRVERWPLLRLVYWPFGWLSRVVGRRLTAARREIKAPLGDPFGYEGRSLEDRVGLFRSHLLADHAVAAERLKLTDEIPSASALAAEAKSALESVGPKIEQELVDSVHQKDRRPSIVGKAFLWLILLWFPFIQPISEGVLQILANEGTFDLVKGLYKVVAALGAVKLLAGFAVVLLIYVALLAAMYARSIRAVRRALDIQAEESPWAQAVNDIFATQVLVRLIEPFQKKWELLNGFRDRLRRVAGSR